MHRALNRLVKMKRKLIILCTLILLTMISIHLFVDTKPAHPFIFPAQCEITDSTDRNHQTLLINKKAVGGIITIKTNNSKIDLIRGATAQYRTGKERVNTLLELLHGAGVEEVDISNYDYLCSGSIYGNCQITFSNRTERYTHYIYFGDSVIYDLWFDRGQISDEFETEIMSNLIVNW